MISCPPYRDFLINLVTRESRPAHKYGHQPRLYELSKVLGAGMTYNDNVVFAAIWLHDLGVFEGNRPSDPTELQRWDHVAYAVRRTVELLPQTDFPHDKIAHVVQVIEEHQPRNTPTSLEAKIVRDADILEQLGAITVLRTAAKLGSDTRFVLFADANSYLRRQLNYLPERLQLPRAKELAVARQRVLGDFLDALEAEAGTHLG